MVHVRPPEFNPERDSFSAFVGSFDAQGMRESIGSNEDSDESLTESGEYGPFNTYQLPESMDDSDVGIRDGEVIMASNRSILEAGIDARIGDGPRLPEQNDQFAGLAEQLTVNDLLQFKASESFDGAAFAFGVGLAADHSVFQIMVDETNAAGATQLGNTMENGLSTAGFNESTVNVSGTMLTVEANVPNEEILGADPLVLITAEMLVLIQTVENEISDDYRDVVLPPQVSFTSNYDREEETLTVTHMSGDTFKAGNIRFEGEGFADPGATWASLSVSDDVTPETDVAAGMRARVDAQPDYLVNLVWEDENPDSASVIFQTQGPQA